MFWFLSSICFSVFQLDEKTYQDYIINGDKSIPWMVMFGSSNCPACHNAAPEFAKASELSRGFARFAYGDTNRMPNVASNLGIKAIPAFFIFTDKGQFEFNGPRTNGGILAFIAEKVSEGLDEADESWVDSPNNKVILFTKRFKPPVIFAAAYGAFKNKNISFGMARDSEVIEMFGKPPVPSIWFYKGAEKIQYKGKQEFSPLIDEISEHFGESIDGNEL